MNKKFIKRPLKGITVTDSAVGTRTPNILMGEHAGEYVRGDIMDANAVIQAFDELKDGVDEGHDTLKELNEEIKTNATVINGVITKVNNIEQSATQAFEAINNQLGTKVDNTAYATKIAELEQRIAALEAKHVA